MRFEPIEWVNDDPDDMPVTWEGECDHCGAKVYRSRGGYDVDCDICGAMYNASGQRLRDDWRGNPSNYDDDISDLDGYEIQHAGD